jgi:hypothetical protein
MGCLGGSSYKAPNFAGPKALAKLKGAYDMQQQAANDWAAPNAATAYNIFSEYAPQYQAQANQMAESQMGTNQATIARLGQLTPEEYSLADQNARAAQAARGNMGGNSAIVNEALNRSDVRNQRINEKLGQFGALNNVNGNPLGLAQNNANGLNYFNPNAGPGGQQAALGLYSGKMQNAMNQYQSDQANNPFAQALGILGGVAKIGGAFGI